MSTGKPKRITLNIYLLKEASNSASEWTDKDFIASPIGSNGKPKKIATEQYPLGPEGEYGTLFIRKPFIEAAPEWLNFIQKGLDKGVKTSKWTNKSISAILIVKNGARQFAISFGYGRHLIEPRLIEDRFGIKVVLNSVSPDKIASIDRQTFDASPRLSRTQTIKAASVSDYMINAEQDLLRGLVGHTKSAYSDIFGKVIAGIDSFKASVAIDLSDLGSLLKLALERSTSKDYLAKDADGHASEFSWVENLLPVKDKDISEELDIKLWQSLSSSRTQNMWLAIPDIIDWTSVTGFAYKPTPDSDDIDPVLDLERFLSTFRQGANLDTLKRREIYLILSNGSPPRPFPAFKCLYAEVKHDANLYILNTGNWFKVEASFQTAVEKYFSELPRKPFAPPFAEYSHAGEGPYNEYVCAQAQSSHAMLDRQMIKFGGSYDKIEVCDIYRVKTQTERGEFIHVKRGRGSSTLSHLFAQGFVASTLMVREPGFVKDVNLQLEKNKFDAIPVNFEARGNDVIYAIIDGPASTALDIPFFSKVTLQNYGKTISSYGYGVKLMHIPESAAHLASIAQKTAEKASKNKQTVTKKKTVRKKPAQPKSGP